MVFLTVLVVVSTGWGAVLVAVTVEVGAGAVVVVVTVSVTAGMVVDTVDGASVVDVVSEGFGSSSVGEVELVSPQACGLFPARTADSYTASQASTIPAPILSAVFQGE